MRRRIKLLRTILQTISAALIVLTPRPTLAIDTITPLPLAYVAPDGDDARDCATPATRCGTLQRALDQLAEGGEVRLASGSYAGTTQIRRSAVIGGGYALPGFSPGGAPTVLDAQRAGTTVWISGPGWIRLQRLDITGGLADATGPQVGQGGGIYIRSANVILDHVQVYGNIAGAGDHGAGGGLYVGDGAVMAQHSAIRSNSALQLRATPFRPLAIQPFAATDTPAINAGDPSGAGGGVYAINARIVLQDSLIDGNQAVDGAKSAPTTATAAGGGLYAESSTIASIDTRFVANQALAGPGASGAGGALRLINSRALIERGEISDNAACSSGEAVGGGGAAAILGGETLISGLALRRNSADPVHAGPGAGILLQPAPASAALTITNVLLAEHLGAALALLPGPSGGVARADVRYATLVSNTIGMQAGPGQAIATVNSIISGGQIAVQALDGGRLALEYSDRYGNAVAADGEIMVGPRGDLALPPGFAPSSDGSYQLDPGSALVDQGAPIAGVDTDFEGQPRIIDGDGDGAALPDLGWDELARSAAAFGPNQTLFALPGQLLTTTMWLRNTGLASDTFQLSIGAPEGWSAAVRPAQVVLAARGAIRLTITIRVADTARLNTQQVLLLRAVGRTSAATALIAVDVGEP